MPRRAVFVPHAQVCQAHRQGSGTQQEGRGTRDGRQRPGFAVPPQCLHTLPPADSGLLQAQVCRKPRGNASSEPGFPAQISQLQEINPTPDSLDSLFYTISTKDGFGPGPRAAFWSLALLCVRLLLTRRVLPAVTSIWVTACALSGKAGVSSLRSTHLIHVYVTDWDQ